MYPRLGNGIMDKNCKEATKGDFDPNMKGPNEIKCTYFQKSIRNIKMYQLFKFHITLAIWELQSNLKPYILDPIFSRNFTELRK